MINASDSVEEITRQEPTQEELNKLAQRAAGLAIHDGNSVGDSTRDIIESAVKRGWHLRRRFELGEL
jgi:hypothetical protein